MERIQVHFRVPGKPETLTAELYEADFIEPQKPGYRFLYQEHLCGMKHTLGNYIPETQTEMDLDIFQFPMVLV